ncbi:HNH endonuclease signature motif containing protein, partial [Microbacterium gubbeenense]|uniref:HNH endonuclease signature motif containing protein n=1 Tax=Microbacterium gubbeenense TaxID=159896 RepID=UPI003F95EFAD
VDQLLDPDRGSGWLENGELASPDTLRILAGRAAGWERLFIRPEDGTIAAADHYRPTAAQKRALLARDMTCRIPGCETTARKCDIDHGHDYALGGRTSLDNLESLCPGHHQMKHQTGWRVRQKAGGVVEFTTPLGRTVTDEPISRVFFCDTPPRGGTARTDADADADAHVQQFLADRGDNEFAQLQRETIRGRQARYADMRRRERELAALGADPEGGRPDDAASDVERDLSWFDDPRALRLEQRWDETFLERLESGLLVGA